MHKYCRPGITLMTLFKEYLEVFIDGHTSLNNNSFDSAKIEFFQATFKTDYRIEGLTQMLRNFESL